jgi:hypothetical protein
MINNRIMFQQSHYLYGQQVDIKKSQMVAWRIKYHYYPTKT